jgi:hypothetical protein
MTESGENRKLSIAMGALIFAGISAFVLTLIIGWRLVPGLLGEWLGVIAGILSTPFFLEASFVILGFFIVICLNNWRRSREGDEFVYLEQVNGPDVPKNLPDHAKWAVYKSKPLAGSNPTLLAQAEGAVAIGDFETAAAIIASMSHEELAENGVLEVRLALAEASGKVDLAERLRREIAAKP